MRALKEWWHTMALIYHDLRREWCEQRGNPRGWHHRERLRYHSTKLMRFRGIQ